MKIVFGEREVRSINKGGLKPLLTRLLLVRPVNAAVLAVARRTLPDGAKHRIPLNRASVEYRSAAGHRVTLLNPDRDIVARDIFWGGGKPTSPADALVLELLARLCRGAGTFVDVGTYAGLFALVAARADDDLAVFAYDIVPENFLLTQRNVIANDLVGRIDCRLRGLGEAPGAVAMPTALGLSSNATSVSLGSRFSGGTRIPVTTLDAEAGDWAGPVVMKIDVEGFEVSVLRGAAALLSRHRPDILCEVLPGDPADVDALEALLRPHGYRFFHPTDAGLIERDRIVPSLAARDWLFSTRPDVDTLLA